MYTFALPALPMPSAGGNLDAYIQSVSRFAFLTHEQEISCAQRFRDHGDIEAARELVVSHLRLVVAIARGYMGYGLPQADLIQEGNVGLMKAVKRFDPERGVRLASFAAHWIRSEMHEYILRNWRIVKIATTKAQRKLFFNLRSMKAGLSTLGNDEVKSIAKQLGVKTEEVVEMETRLGGQDVALEPGGADDEESYSPIATLCSEDAEPVAAIEHEQNTRLRGDGLVKALDSLDARSRRIIEARWLSEKKPLMLRDLADEFKVSAERIRQIENKALGKLKDAMATLAAT
jgi:RNA polymerase sigma-32 factor